MFMLRYWKVFALLLIIGGLLGTITFQNIRIDSLKNDITTEQLKIKEMEIEVLAANKAIKNWKRKGQNLQRRVDNLLKNKKKKVKIVFSKEAPEQCKAAMAWMINEYEKQKDI